MYQTSTSGWIPVSLSSHPKMANFHSNIAHRTLAFHHITTIAERKRKYDYARTARQPPIRDLHSGLLFLTNAKSKTKQTVSKLQFEALSRPYWVVFLGFCEVYDGDALTMQGHITIMSRSTLQNDPSYIY